MREVRFSAREEGGTPAFVALAKEMADLKKMSGRVYRAYSTADSKPCVLVTTSGQIYLELGRLTAEGLRNLCKVIVEESAQDESGEGLIIGRNHGTQMFVTPFHRNDAGFIFHLSPAGGHGHGHHNDHGDGGGD